MGYRQIQRLQREIAQKKAEIAQALGPDIRRLNDQYIWQIATERFYQTHGLDLIKRQALAGGGDNKPAILAAILEATQKIWADELPKGIISVDSFLPEKPKSSFFGTEKKLRNHLAKLTDGEVDYARAVRKQLAQAEEQSRQRDSAFTSQQNSGAAFYAKAYGASQRRDVDGLLSALTAFATQEHGDAKWKQTIAMMTLAGGKTVAETLFEATDATPLKQGAVFGTMAALCPPDVDQIEWCRLLEGTIKNPVLAKKWRVYENALIGTMLPVDGKILNLQTIAELQEKKGSLIATAINGETYAFPVGTEKARWLARLVGGRTTHFSLPDGRVLNSAAINHLSYVDGKLLVQDIMGRDTVIEMPQAQAEATVRNVMKTPAFVGLDSLTALNASRVVLVKDSGQSLNVTFQNGEPFALHVTDTARGMFHGQLQRLGTFKEVTAQSKINLSSASLLRPRLFSLEIQDARWKRYHVKMSRREATKNVEELSKEDLFLSPKKGIVIAKASLCALYDVACWLGVRLVSGREKNFLCLSAKKIQEAFASQAARSCLNHKKVSVWDNDKCFFANGITRVKIAKGKMKVFLGEYVPDSGITVGNDFDPAVAFGMVPFGSNDYIRPDSFLFLEERDKKFYAEGLRGEIVVAENARLVRSELDLFVAEGQKTFAMMKAGHNQRAFTQALLHVGAWMGTARGSNAQGQASGVSVFKLAPSVLTAALHFGAKLPAPRQEGDAVVQAARFAGVTLPSKESPRAELLSQKVSELYAVKGGISGMIAAVGGSSLSFPLRPEDCKSGRNEDSFSSTCVCVDASNFADCSCDVGCDCG